MGFLNILNNWVSRSGSAKPEPAPRMDENAILDLTETLYSSTIAVMNDLPQLQQADFDFALLTNELLRPMAHYLAQQATYTQAYTPFVKPLFVSGVPGIGKTTLLMVLDEVLYRLNSSCRDLVISGKIQGYFPHKTILNVTPLQLFGKSTGMLSVRDWNNLIRHWTFDETTADTNPDALADLTARLRGNVVFMDEAELEGYVYISELLARHGILVILTSNLHQTQIHLAPEHVHHVSLQGSDHRTGNIAHVCLPNQPHALFDRFAEHFVRHQKLYVASGLVGGVNITYLNWGNLERHPLMKDDFARLFRENKTQAVLLDAVPFFANIPASAVDLSFLGYLARFVNFVDAIHDTGLPLLIRGMHQHILDPQTAGNHLDSILAAYDERVEGHYGQVARIEWARCLSRLQSREAINAEVWPLEVEQA